MSDENEEVSQDEQALADEWAAALAEAGDAGQDDIDALMSQTAPASAETAAPRAAMEEFAPAAPLRASTMSGSRWTSMRVIRDAVSAAMCAAASSSA